jgi:hypothetical protein
MPDSLVARVDQALHCSVHVRHQRRMLLNESEEAIRQIRRSILESASARAETSAQREDRTKSEAR